jgi:hypothetical protein
LRLAYIVVRYFLMRNFFVVLGADCS